MTVIISQCYVVHNLVIAEVCYHAFGFSANLQEVSAANGLFEV